MYIVIKVQIQSCFQVYQFYATFFFNSFNILKFTVYFGEYGVKERPKAKPSHEI